MRTRSALGLAALSGGQVTMRWIVRVNLPGSGWFGASDAPDNFVWNNGATGDITYIGCDELLAVQLPPLTGAPRPDPATVSLSATDPRLLAQLIDEAYRGAPVDIALLLFENGVPGEEWLKFRGRGGETTFTDAPVKVNESGKDADAPTISTVAMTVWPATVDMKRANGRMATNVDQQLFRDPLDTFFQDVALVGVSTINFGQAGNASPAASATTRSAEGAASGMAALAGSIGARLGGALQATL